MKNIYKKSFKDVFVSLLLILILSACVFPSVSLLASPNITIDDGAGGGGGAKANSLIGGTSYNNAYEISTASELASVSSGYFILLNNINCNSILTTINISDRIYIDGKGFTVSINSLRPNGQYCGLFGSVKSGEIKNLNVKIKKIDIQPSENSYFGGICAYSEGNIISNCNNYSDSLSFDNKLMSFGGIVGTTNSSLSNCVNYSNINAQAVYGGGIVGNGGIVSNCFNYGAIESHNLTSSYIGGIAGVIADISYSQNLGTISAASGREASLRIGGVCGRGSNVSYCANESTVTARNVGGEEFIVGGIVGSLVENMDMCKNSGDIRYAESEGFSSNPSITLAGICAVVQNTNASVSIRKCLSVGNLISNLIMNSKVGGICGMALADITIENSIAKCSLTFSNYSDSVEDLSLLNYLGSIIGHIYDNKTATITNCSAEIQNQFKKIDSTDLFGQIKRGVPFSPWPNDRDSMFSVTEHSCSVNNGYDYAIDIYAVDKKEVTTILYYNIPLVGNGTSSIINSVNYVQSLSNYNIRIDNSRYYHEEGYYKTYTHKDFLGFKQNIETHSWYKDHDPVWTEGANIVVDSNEQIDVKYDNKYELDKYSDRYNDPFEAGIYSISFPLDSKTSDQKSLGSFWGTNDIDEKIIGEGECSAVELWRRFQYYTFDNNNYSSDFLDFCSHEINNYPNYFYLSAVYNEPYLFRLDGNVLTLSFRFRVDVHDLNHSPYNYEFVEGEYTFNEINGDMSVLRKGDANAREGNLSNNDISDTINSSNDWMVDEEGNCFLKMTW